MTAADHTAAVAELLAGLGDTPDAVADTLRAKGIKGKRGDFCGCPVARCVQELLGTENANVSDVWVYFVAGRVPTPRPVSDFLSLFDRGVYLDLVEVEAR